MSRRELANQVRDARHVARQIERFLAVARKPGKDEETLRTAEELAELPKMLKRYCKFAVDVGQACYIPREKRLQRDRCLLSLVEHVKTVTGKPHWEDLLNLISAWKLVMVQDWKTLQVQFRRAHKPGQLPLFGPKSQAKQKLGAPSDSKGI